MEIELRYIYPSLKLDKEIHWIYTQGHDKFHACFSKQISIFSVVVFGLSIHIIIQV